MDTFTFNSPSGESSYNNYSIMSSRYAIFPQDFVKINNKKTTETFSSISTGVPPTPPSSVTVTTRKPSQYKKHPPIASIIDEAIYVKSPHRKGLSLFAVKKFLQEKYNINVKHSARKIREYIRESLESGRFIQTTGKGANGSFRLSKNVRAYLNKKNRNSPTRSGIVNRKSIKGLFDSLKKKKGPKDPRNNKKKE